MRLRAAVAAAGRRALRREPVPPREALPVPGRPQAVAGRHPGLYVDSLARSGIVRPSTTSASRRTTGSRRRSAPGASAGRSSSTGWRSPSSPTSSRPAASTSPRARPRSPTASSGSRCSSRGLGTYRHRVGAGAVRTARCAGRTSTRSRSTASRSPTRTLLRLLFDRYEAESRRCLDGGARRPGLRGDARSARTPSTCSTRAAPSRRPSASASSSGSATSPSRCAKAYVSGRKGSATRSRAGARGGRAGARRARRARRVFRAGERSVRRRPRGQSRQK